MKTVNELKAELNQLMYGCESDAYETGSEADKAYTARLTAVKAELKAREAEVVAEEKAEAEKKAKAKAKRAATKARKALEALGLTVGEKVVLKNNRTGATEEIIVETAEVKKAYKTVNKHILSSKYWEIVK